MKECNFPVKFRNPVNAAITSTLFVLRMCKCSAICKHLGLVIFRQASIVFQLPRTSPLVSTFMAAFLIHEASGFLLGSHDVATR